MRNFRKCWVPSCHDQVFGGELCKRHSYIVMLEKKKYKERIKEKEQYVYEPINNFETYQQIGGLNAIEER